MISLEKTKGFHPFDKNENFDIFQLIKDENPSIERDLIDKQILNDLQKIIIKLPQDQKEVINMRLYKEMSFKEISENYRCKYKYCSWENEICNY